MSETEKPNPLPGERKEDPKYAYRLPPCPDYDVEGVESWLSAMAEKGLVLSKEGRFCGFGIFEKAEPRTLRYRLEAAPKPRRALDHMAPTEEAEELYAVRGWRYVAQWGHFFIYCADSPDAPELNTDPKVQAISLRIVRKRARSSLITTAFWLLIYPLLYFRGGVARALLTLDTLFILLTLLTVLWLLAHGIVQAVHFRRLGRSLAAGKPLDHEKDWRKRVLRYRTATFLRVALILAWCACLLNYWSDEVMEVHEIALSQYEKDVPFATVADFFPEGNHALRDNGYSNTVTERSNLFLPVMIDYSENAVVTLPGGKAAEGALDVVYIEAAWPFLAQRIARETFLDAKWEDRYEPLPLPPLEGMDYAAGYMHYFPTVVLQKGERMLCATYYGYSDGALPYETWVARLAESMASPLTP